MITLIKERKYLIEAAFVYYYHDWIHGSAWANMMQQEELRVLYLDKQAVGNSMLNWT